MIEDFSVNKEAFRGRIGEFAAAAEIPELKRLLYLICCRRL
jgi:hypothetical protein